MKSLLYFLVATLAVTGISQAAPYPPTHFPDASGWGRNLQRTMRLLATSRPEHHNTVRILFYGQSITEQKWTMLVEDDLRRHFPHANLIVENRALGGFASQMLAHRRGRLRCWARMAWPCCNPSSPLCSRSI